MLEDVLQEVAAVFERVEMAGLLIQAGANVMAKDKNGEIHVNTYGTPEGKPLASGYQDFKPSWSKTGDMLVFFRRLKDDRVVTH